MPPPRRANREPTEYISQADWDAIRDYRAFKSAAPETTASSPPANDAASAVSETTASAVELTTPRSSATTASSPPANDAASAVSETTASAVDLTTPQEWAENYCRRPLEPFVFGVFFDTHNVSDRLQLSYGSAKSYLLMVPMFFSWLLARSMIHLPNGMVL